MNLRKAVPAIALGALVAVLAGCGGGGKSEPAGGGGAAKGDVAKGQQVFAGTCSACHGQDAKGMPGLGKNLVTKSDWMKKQTDDQLIAFVKQGRPASDPVNTTKVDMPPKGGNPSLTDEDITNVVAYIRSIQAK